MLCDKMFNKRKVLILFVIFTIAVGFTIASVSSVNAAKKTVNFKEGQIINKNLGNNVYLGALFSGKYSGKWKNEYFNHFKKNEIKIWISYYPKHYKMTKAKVYFKKTNGKIVSKTYKGSYISKKVPYGWKPKKAVIYYKRR